MGRLGKQFPRFPHRCTIYSVAESTPFGEGDKVVLWTGACRKESNSSIRTFKGTESVLKSDYRVQLGCKVGDPEAAYDTCGFSDEVGAIVEGIVAGMFIDVEDKQGNFEGLTISDAYSGNLGTTVFCDHPKN
jgi:hypothetical protein